MALANASADGVSAPSAAKITSSVTEMMTSSVERVGPGAAPVTVKSSQVKHPRARYMRQRTRRWLRSPLAQGCTRHTHTPRASTRARQNGHARVSLIRARSHFTALCPLDPFPTHSPPAARPGATHTSPNVHGTTEPPDRHPPQSISSLPWTMPCALRDSVLTPARSVRRRIRQTRHPAHISHAHKNVRRLPRRRALH